MNREQLLSTESDSEAQTKKFALNALSYFDQGDTILLYGNLGSGKTFLVQQFAKALGVKEDVTSPTFSIINQYSGNFIIHHIDLYRIPERRDLINLGLEDLWDMDSIKFVEWPQLIEDQMPNKHHRIFISVNPARISHRSFTLYKYLL
jgi:tRNA threonylcarbamoyladenosine biosynthesis protein TsaE